MRIRNNAPEIYSNFQDQFLRSPSVEDGNIPEGELQGKIFTSEITASDDYSVSYSAKIVSVSSNLRETGNLSVYTFVIRYDAILSPSPATNPGLFGSNLIKNGDPFVVAVPSGDWVRGYIGSVKDITFTPAGSTYTYTYTLECAVTQGEPLTIKAGDLFDWNRQLYQDPSTFNNAVPPINFSASYNRDTQDLYFYWEDVNQESRKYRIMARDVSSPSNYFIYTVPGKDQNAKISVKPFVSAGVITTYKIEDPGTNAANIKALNIIGSGTGAVAYTYLNDKGELLINEFTVYDANVGGSEIFVYSEKPIYDAITTYRDWPIPNLGSYVDKLPSLNSTSDFVIDGVSVVGGNNRYLMITLKEAETFNSLNIMPAWRSSILNTKIHTHDGVVNVNNGTGYTGKVIARAKETSQRPNFYADPVYWGSFLPGTTWAFSVSAIYDEINKLYTEWSIEEYIKF